MAFCIRLFFLKLVVILMMCPEAYLSFYGPAPVTFVMTLVKSVYRKFNFLISQPKTYVVGTKKNGLNETVLLSTQNIC